MAASESCAWPSNLKNRNRFMHPLRKAQRLSDVAEVLWSCVAW